MSCAAGPGDDSEICFRKQSDDCRFNGDFDFHFSNVRAVADAYLG